MGKSKTLVSICSEISVSLAEIESVATTCWFVEAHAQLILC